MSDPSEIAAQEWARAHAPNISDPVKFGHQVALAYCAARAAQYGGDDASTAAALAALSIPLEVLQALEQVACLLTRPAAQCPPKDGVGAV